MRAELIEVIGDTFTSKGNDWDERLQQEFCAEVGVTGDWRQAADSDLRKILGYLEKYKMVLLENETIEKSEDSPADGGVIVALYADGGVIKKNPSPYGGTWAWCAVDGCGNRVIEKSGVVPATATRTVSNNHTEQIAITLALEAMPDGWSGTVHSDSQIALGRVFKGWREENLPANISIRSRRAVARLGRIQTVLLQGHPTRADLENGIGKKRGYPVSVHNVWCDKACGKAAEEYLKTLEVCA